MNKAILFCLMLATAFPARAQKVDVFTTAAPLEQATISDVDFIRSTTPKWLFTLDLRMHPQGNQVQEVFLELRGDLALATGRSAEDIFYLKSKQFLLSPARTITNLDLRNPDLKDRYAFDESKLEALGIKQVALSGALLPAGVYTINVDVTKVDNGRPTGQVGKAKIVYVLRNPTRVELLFPIDGDRAVSPFPLFQWLFDGSSSTLCVFEKLPGQQSLEEIASGVPILKEQVNTTYFQYPSGGVRALQAGKTYVWYVAGRALSAGGGSQDIRSTLRSFKVSQAGGYSSFESLLDDLERTLGPKYKTVFDQIRESEFTSTGTLQLNGTPITADQLKELLQQMRANPDIVRSVRVE
jgi:hypothetical protein